VLSTGNSQWNVRRADIESLEIRGAGIDRTTLVGPGWAFLCCDAKAKAKNLLVHDLAIDATKPEQIVLDARGAMSVAMERVRFLGWQSGAGHGAVVGVTGQAFVACRDCDFEGTGGGFVLSLRSGAVAALENCRFSSIDAVLIGSNADALGKPSVVNVTGCTFENAPLADSRTSGNRGPRISISVRGGTVRAGGRSWTEEKRRAAWGASYAAVVEGVTFLPAAPAFTIADLERVLEAAPAQGIETVVQVDVIAGPRSEPVVVDLYAWDRAAATATCRTFRWSNATLTPCEDARSRRNTFVGDLTADEVASFLPMVELVRHAGVALDEGVSHVEFGRKVSTTAGGAEQRTRWLQISEDRETPWFVDAKTGEPVKSR
jgi:hypothetical protein